MSANANRRLALLLAAAGACYWSAAIGDLVRLPGPYPLGDFFAFWSSAQVLASGPAGVLYDGPALHALQAALGSTHGELIPYPYPPHAALLLLPLAGLSYWAAAALWLGGGLALYAAALALGQPRAEVRGIALAALLAPTTAITCAYGQGGLLVAALLIGGLRLADARPVPARVLAGVLFGLLTWKPQFGLMVPVALIAAGQWRCVGAAVLAAAALALAATAWQGVGVWGAWLAYLPEYQAWFADRALGVMPTVQASLMLLGAADAWAHAAQAAAAALAAAAVWRSWRRHDPARVPVALAATALATPHGFIYDLPLLSGAVILFAAQRLRRGMGRAELAGLLAVLAFPIALNMRSHELPIAAPMLLLALGLFLRGGLTGADPFAISPASTRHGPHAGPAISR